MDRLVQRLDRQGARRLAAAAAGLLLVALCGGCIEGATFQGGADPGGGPQDVAAMDGPTDVQSQDVQDVLRKDVVDAGAPRDISDGGGHDVARPDVEPPRDVVDVLHARDGGVDVAPSPDAADAHGTDALPPEVTDVGAPDGAPGVDAAADTAADAAADTDPADVASDVPLDLPAGSRCQGDGECASGECLTPAEAAALHPGLTLEAAVCAVLDCSSDDDCGAAGVCASWSEADGASRACFVACGGAADCDEGFTCVALDGDTRFCHPDDVFWCEDGNACTVEGFDAETGTCGHAARECGDADACNGTERCDPAVGCQPGEALACADDDVCDGTEWCDATAGCQPGEPLDCDDGDACNGVETCDPTAGCQDGSAPECDDGDVCDGAESCDPAAGCQPGEPLVCGDEDACNGAETCHPTDGCQPGVPPVCDDENVCNGVETCDAAEGCQPGAPLACDDGAWCNGAETCDATAGCQDGAAPDCDDGLDCTVDACDDEADGCRNTPRDTACDDGNDCTVDVCDPQLGCQYDEVADGTGCGEGVECRAGECVWDGTCGGVTCPPLPDYGVECNPQAHCEYRYEGADTAEWRRWDMWIWVPPGSFPMGRPDSESGEPDRDEVPQHVVTIARGVFLGKYEILVAASEACEATGACTAPSVADWDGEGWGLNRSSNERALHPQNGLRWQNAVDFCAWQGGRLPSEAEWEYAAKGPVHRKYPWGDTPEPTCANGTAVFNEAGGTGGYGCATGGTQPVGSKAAGAAWCGAFDMAGNVWEWTADFWHSDYEGAPTDGTAWVSPIGWSRVIRGGPFTGVTTLLRSASRHSVPPTWGHADFGARCVRDLSPVGVYCNTACPALPGYDAACNAQNHCEYARSEPTEAWHEWDVWIWVPPGSFDMGEEGSVYAEPVHTVTFAEGYYFAKYEVVVSQHEACEAAGVCDVPSVHYENLGWPLNRSATGQADHPQNALTRSQLETFCAWAANPGLLASEAQWEYAARGATGRRYPWGEMPEPSCDNDTAVFNQAPLGAGCGTRGTWPVGSMPAGASYVGALDMGGNVMDQVRDCWDGTYDGAPADGSARTGPADCAGTYRGAAYDEGPERLQTFWRGVHAVPELGYTALGGRCVRLTPCAAGETATPDGCAIAGAACAGHADGVLCEDGDPCTAGDACQAGVCVPSGPRDCDDGNACTTDTCAAPAGCTHTPVVCANADWCDGVETCDPALGCQPGLPPDCDDGVACTVDNCDDVADACTHTPEADACDDSDPCTADTCHAQLGCQAPALPDGAGCGAGHACLDGACVATLTCGGSECPVLSGYAVTCNAQSHCEYARAAPGAPWQTFDVVVWIGPGPFPMGNAAPAYLDESPEHTVTFGAGYWIDRYEVSAAAFAAFLNERGNNDCDGQECLRSNGTGIPTVEWHAASGQTEVRASCQATPGGDDADCGAHPVVDASWYGAAAFCAWNGKRVCSEAEWERAAKGTTQRLYPWGGSTFYVGAEQGNCSPCPDAFAAWAPVDAFGGGDSPSGCRQMAGNVWEWVDDDWHASYDGAPGDGTAWVADPRGASGVIRGGSALDGVHDLTTTNRMGMGRTAGAGLRCCL